MVVVVDKRRGVQDVDVVGPEGTDVEEVVTSILEIKIMEV